MSKHTPGPWRCRADGKYAGRYHITAAGALVAVSVSCTARDAERANARLIAAAPEMLDALKHARRNMPHPDQMIDDAIAKAEGEET